MKTTAAAAWLVIPWLVILAIKSLEAWAYVRLSGQPFEIPSLLRGEVSVAVAGLVVTPFALWLGFRWPLTRAAGDAAGSPLLFSLASVFHVDVIQHLVHGRTGAAPVRHAGSTRPRAPIGAPAGAAR